MNNLYSIRGGRDRRDDSEHRSGRVPPHNLEAEASVLGSMLNNPTSCAVVMPLLQAGDFYRPANAAIYDAMVTLSADGQPVDTVVVAEHLKTTGTLDDIGGPGYLVELQSVGCYGSVIAARAEIVAKHSRLRQIIGLAGELAESSYDLIDPAVIVAKLKDDVDGLVGATNRRNRLFNASDHLDSHLDIIDARANDDREKTTGIRTEWHQLDQLIGGLRPGQLVVIAGRPGMGKSAVAAGIALRTAVTVNLRVLTVSIEMSFEELMDRYYAAVSHVKLTKVRSGDLETHEWSNLNSGAVKLAEKNLWVLDDPNATLPSIHAAAQRTEADLVIVDYLQLVSTVSSRNVNREREVAELSGGLKRMARDLGVPVIALSQFNRAVDGRHSDKRPQLTDLRESGAIENDADVVIGLYRDDYYNPDSAQAGKLEMIVLKQRNGPTGVATLSFDAPTGYIANQATGKPF